MIREISWTDRALNEYENLVDYLYGEFGETVTLRVIAELNQSVARIQQNPEQFPFYIKSKHIRRCVASPQTSIYFKVNKDIIALLSLFNNKQNPNKRKL